MELIKSEIFSYLEKQQSPIGLKRLEQRLKLKRNERSYLRMLLQEMTREGLIQRTENGGYRVSPPSSGKRGEHQASPLIKACHVCILKQGRGGFTVQPRGRRKAIPVRWPDNMDGRPVDGDLAVVVENNRGTNTIAGIERSRRGRLWGRIEGDMFRPVSEFRRPVRLRVKGDSDVAEILLDRTPRVLTRFKNQLSSATGISKYRHNLIDLKKAWNDASLMPSPVVERRTDLLDLMTFTIDGADAKDFDDALSIEKTDSGYRLWVHIADVSAFVIPGSDIDREAMLRGVSVYLPGHTLPMLPEVLSNDLCSLKPEEERLTLSVQFQLDRRFGIQSFAVERTRIRSRFRLRYDHVNEYLHNGHHGEEEWAKALNGRLRLLKRFAESRRAMRIKRGSIMLNIPRPYLTLTEGGQVSTVVGEVHGMAEQIVEECMLLVNETVGSLMVERGMGSIFRIHPAPGPEMMEAIQHLQTELNLVEHVESLPELINSMDDPKLHYIILRLMGKARYSGSPGLHFGLGTSNYLHFTSPIRRFADLVVHRMLKAWLDRVPAPYSRTQLTALADLISFREKKAFYAELDLADCLLLEKLQHCGTKQFSGIVSGVSEKGLYVELDKWFVDGFVPLSDLRGHYELTQSGFALENNFGSLISIGTPIEVTIRKIDPLLRILKLRTVDTRL